MVKVIVVGNLGADAEVVRENGRAYVRFRVADTQRKSNPDGTTKEKTQWISCFWNGDGGRLLQHLKKGARVHCYGDADVNQYHSEKQRALVAGITCFVRDIELCGGKPDLVPAELYDTDGCAHRISKFYHAPGVKSSVLFSRSSVQFNVDESGWVTPAGGGFAENSDGGAADGAHTDAKSGENGPGSAGN